MTRTYIAACLLVVLCHGAHAADDRDQADALVTKGLQLRRDGKTLEAIQMFDRADAIYPSPRSVGQLGLAEVAVEHWSDAEKHLEDALSTPQDSWVKKTRAVLEQARSLAQTHVGQISLTGLSGASIVISGRAVGTLPLAKPIRADAGTALVVATAPGFKPFELSIPVQAGKETQLRIELQPLYVVPPQPGLQQRVPRGGQSHALSTEDTAVSSWRTWTGGAIVAAGGGLAVWGIVWIALDGHYSSSGSCSDGAPIGCRPVYHTKTAGILLAGSGAAAAIAGGILIYSSKAHAAEVGIAAGPTSLTLAGRF